MVIAVLAVLTAMVLPRFICIIPWSQAVAARKRLADIKKEYFVKTMHGTTSQFEQSKLNGYTIISDGIRGCAGSQDGLIIASPSNPSELPEFQISISKNTISCSFKGVNYDDADSLSLIHI